MKQQQWMAVLVVLLLGSVAEIEGRGGRGRGGGFGGIFGGLWKSKKGSSGGSSRRIISSSPTHYANPSGSSKTSLSSASSGSSSSLKHGPKANAAHASYPRQQMPTSNSYSYGGRSYNYNQHQLPPNTQHYASATAVPQGAVFYQQPPPSLGMGNFFLGYMTGNALSHLMYPRYHDHHIYHHHNTAAETAPSAPGTKVIIINNGDQVNATEVTPAKIEGTDVPLAPFNSSIPLPPEAPIANEPVPSSEIPANLPYGILCVPETPPADSKEDMSNKKIICFPAPPPPPPPSSSSSSVGDEGSGSASTLKENCVSGLFVESDPNDPTKTIEVHKEKCMNGTTGPKEIVGEIQAAEDLHE